jgi:outer membrane protein OmpA-like peptidoglycan-associated protein
VNRFFTGFIVFLFYAVLCFSFLELALPSLGISSLTMAVNPGTNEEFKDSFDSDEPEIQDEFIFEEESQELKVDSTILDLEPAQEILGEESLSNDVPSSSAPAESLSPATFNITLPNGVLLLSCESFATVYKDVDKVKIPFPCRDYGLTIQTYLEENPKAILLITGFSDPSEVATIGKRRADYVKRLLSNTGITQDRILTSVAIRNLNIDKGYASGGIRMEIKGSVPVSVPVANGTSDPTSNSTTENSGTSRTLASKKFTSGFQGNYFYGDQKFTSYMPTIKTLLSQNPAAKVYAYSYTNIDGDDKDNFAISRDNSGTVRKILIQSGIPSNKIQSVARGEQNSGTAGSNRCIIITVK